MSNLIEQLKIDSEYVSREGLGGNYYEIDIDRFAWLIMKECSIACTTPKCGRECSAEELISEHFGITL